MAENKLEQTVQNMIGDEQRKIIMAMDESIGTMGNRLQAAGLEPNKENREAWRMLIVTAEDLPGVGAAILYEGTVFQDVYYGRTAYEQLAKKGIVPGVKLDNGKVELIGPYRESTTIGLDNLHERLEKYERAVSFAKWRSELVIGEQTPSNQAIQSNAYGLAVFAHLCQQHGIVPIVEPEVLIKGSHDIGRAYETNQRVLRAVFEKLDEMGVYLPGAILKASFVSPGDKYVGGKASPEEVAKATIDCWTEGNLVPKNIGAVVLLSGGLSDIDAVQYLNAINQPEMRERSPLRVSASYGRAEIGEALEHWRGNPDRVKEAQKIIAERTYACGLASNGKLPSGFQYRLTANKT